MVFLHPNEQSEFFASAGELENFGASSRLNGAAKTGPGQPGWSQFPTTLNLPGLEDSEAGGWV